MMYSVIKTETPATIKVRQAADLSRRNGKQLWNCQQLTAIIRQSFQMYLSSNIIDIWISMSMPIIYLQIQILTEKYSGNVLIGS